MDIEILEKYKSIDPIKIENLPDFTVVTGANGAGKTQLLEAISNVDRNKKVIISNPSININDIYYNSGNWNLPKTGQGSIDTYKKTINAAETGFTEFLMDFIRLPRNDSLKKFSTHVFLDSLKRLERHIEKQVNKENYKSVKKEEIGYALVPYVLKPQSHKVTEKISQLFYQYHCMCLNYRDFNLKKKSLRTSLGIPPWEILEEFIEVLELPITFEKPTTERVVDNFQANIRHDRTGRYVALNDLSSGEKVLISIGFWSFAARMKANFPKLIVLDEPDAHLHPSMTQILINILQNLFIKKYGTKVIISTHSPSTVALSPEKSIYEMRPEYPRLTLANSKASATALLTSGLTILFLDKTTIFVEGNDDRKFFQAVLQNLNNNKRNNIIFSPIGEANKETISSGGRSKIIKKIKELQDINEIKHLYHGIVDRDDKPINRIGITCLSRYAIENYLYDPLNLYACYYHLNDDPDLKKIPNIKGVSKVTKPNEIENLPNNELQKISDFFSEKILNKGKFDISKNRMITKKIKYKNKLTIRIPLWYLYNRGKDISSVVNSFFPKANIGNLIECYWKYGLIPDELKKKIENLT